MEEAEEQLWAYPLISVNWEAVELAKVEVQHAVQRQEVVVQQVANSTANAQEQEWAHQG